jgi:hypothetical protein
MLNKKAPTVNVLNSFSVTYDPKCASVIFVEKACCAIIVWYPTNIRKLVRTNIRVSDGSKKKFEQ